MISLPVLSPYSPEALAGAVVGGGTTLVNVTSLAWPVANRLLGYPVRILSPTLITKLWIANGTTAAGNLDVGIYDARGTLVVSSGSTAQSGTSTMQVLDITDTRLGLGDYYVCAVMDGVTGTSLSIGWAGNFTQGVFQGVVIMDSAFPLPAIATFLSADSTLSLFGALVWPRTVI